MWITKKKIIQSYIYPIAYHLANSFEIEVIFKRKKKVFTQF